MPEQTITVSDPREAENCCWISISSRDVSVRFDRPLPDAPHRATRTELMAAGALMGIAGVLTGKGADDILHALAKFERDARRKTTRR